MGLWKNIRDEFSRDQIPKDIKRIYKLDTLDSKPKSKYTSRMFRDDARNLSGMYVFGFGGLALILIGIGMIIYSILFISIAIIQAMLLGIFTGLVTALGGYVMIMYALDIEKRINLKG